MFDMFFLENVKISQEWISSKVLNHLEYVSPGVSRFTQHNASFDNRNNSLII